jgi:hypothetical protein
MPSKNGPFKRSVTLAMERSAFNGSIEMRALLNDKPVYKELQVSTQKNYLHSLELWDG